MDPDSFIAIAGRVGDGIYGRISGTMDCKFSGAARPDLLPHPDSRHQPQDIVACCYLFKNLDYRSPYEQLDVPIEFGNEKVIAFGMGDRKYHPDTMTSQTIILDYQSRNDFIIEIATRSASDRLILARIEPGATLTQTIAEAKARRQSGKRQQTDSADVLLVPKMNFDVVRSYSELTGRQLISDAGAAPMTKLVAADQTIRFLMDEKGVQLKSEAAVISLGCAASPMPHPTHIMVFDKPYLLMLERDGAKQPYFAAWIDNPELLEPAVR